MTETMLWALPLIPAAAGILGLLLSPGERVFRLAAGLALAATGSALAVAILLWGAGGIVSRYRPVVDFGKIEVGLSVHFDTVTALVALAVTAVAFLVQLYSVGYMRQDDRYVPYAAQINLFTAAMLLVVVADDLVLLLIGWEIMGAMSYLLIGHDRQLPEAPAAAIKAFLVTRVGDVGFLLGVVLLGIHADTFHIPTIVENVAAIPHATLLAACLLLLAGAAGKSAQFPLHTWLGDAMAGPTPVSALIHAATMVASGAYLLYRLEPLYAAATVAVIVIAVMAAITMLLAASAALAADDLKRVLAWSTVSQVAFMFGGFAVAMPDTAIAHLLSHAAFKALLFLGAGVLIHMVGSNSMSAMGGLRRGAPVTFWTMTVAFAALAGIPPLAGFFSKDAILGAASEATTIAGTIVWWAGLATVALTAAYATRAWLRVFFGRARSSFTVKDPQPVMRWPLVVLAVPTVTAGAVFHSGTLALPKFHLGPMLIVLTATALGAAASYLLWRRDPAGDPAAVLGGFSTVLARGFYCDEAQDALITRPVLALARGTRFGDERLLDGAVERTGSFTSTVSALATRAIGGLPRHLLATLGGAVLIVALSAATYWGVLS